MTLPLGLQGKGNAFLLTRPSRDVTVKQRILPDNTTISTHTSLAGRDNDLCVDRPAVYPFLLTRPSRDVTCNNRLRCRFHRFLLTRPSRDVTCYRTETWEEYCRFLLTRPSRDVTSRNTLSDPCYPISTHTSLAGRDGTDRLPGRCRPEFLLTRPSRDVTRAKKIIREYYLFLLTRPSRDVTKRLDTRTLFW